MKINSLVNRIVLFLGVALVSSSAFAINGIYVQINKADASVATADVSVKMVITNSLQTATFGTRLVNNYFGVPIFFGGYSGARENTVTLTFISPAPAPGKGSCTFKLPVGSAGNHLALVSMGNAPYGKFYYICPTSPTLKSMAY